MENKVIKADFKNKKPRPRGFWMRFWAIFGVILMLSSILFTIIMYFIWGF